MYKNIDQGKYIIYYAMKEIISEINSQSAVFVQICYGISLSGVFHESNEFRILESGS